MIRRRRESGFTLLEMIVATALMSITVVGLLSLISGSLANASRIKQYDQAAMLARTKMNDLLLLTPLPLGQSMGGQWDADTGWTAVAEVFERQPGMGPGGSQLVRIQLDVWWKSARDTERRSIRLEGFRRQTIPMEGRR